MGLELMNRVWPIQMHHAHKLTLLALADRADDKTGACFPSIRWLAERTSLSDRSVRRAIESLVEEGHLTVTLRNGGSSDYVVHPGQPDLPTPVTLTGPTDAHPGHVDRTPRSERPTPPVTLTGHPGQPDLHIPFLSPIDPRLIPERGQTTRSKGGKTKCSRMPDGTPTEHMRAWVTEHCPGVDFDRELQLLRDHEFRSPRSDWDAVIRTWMTRADQFRANNNRSNNGTSNDRHVTKFERVTAHLEKEDQGFG